MDLLKQRVVEIETKASEAEIRTEKLTKSCEEEKVSLKTQYAEHLAQKNTEINDIKTEKSRELTKLVNEIQETVDSKTEKLNIEIGEMKDDFNKSEMKFKKERDLLEDMDKMKQSQIERYEQTIFNHAEEVKSLRETNNNLENTVESNQKEI